MHKILLRHNSISRHIDDHQLILILLSCELSIQVNESTILPHQCLMMVYVRFFNENIQLCEIKCCLTQKVRLFRFIDAVFNEDPIEQYCFMCICWSACCGG